MSEELIRKKDALDALMAERKHLLANGQKGAEHILTHHGYNVIDELKPVQSDVPEMNVGDMISKQAATTIPVMPKEHRHYQTNNLDDAYEQGWNDLQECIENLPSAQPERRYTVRELSVFRHGISLSLCSKKSAQRWHYDKDTAIEIEFLEHLYEKVGEDMRGCKDADD